MTKFLLLVLMLCSCSAEKTDSLIENSHVETSRKDKRPRRQTVSEISLPSSDPTQAQVFENEFLRRVLKEEFGNEKGFTVIRPKATAYLKDWETEYTQSLCVIISNGSNINKSVICSLLEQLVDKNRSEPALTLVSSRKDGFIVDYPDEFVKYFRNKDNGGWERWRVEHPDANSLTTVSLPAVDEKNGLLIVYIGIQSGGLVGKGGLLIFSYSDKDLKLLHNYQLWISSGNNRLHTTFYPRSPRLKRPLSETLHTIQSQ